MLDISAFTALLENAQSVEEEVFDPRFEEAVALVEQEKFKEATPCIEALLKKGCIDIRLVMYLFYAHFLEEGVRSLADIFLTILSIVEKHWDKISPAQTRDKHASTSFIWFFSSVSKKLKRSEKLYKEKRPDDFWNQSLEQLSHQDLNEIKMIIHRLQECFADELDHPSINQSIMFIGKWIADLEQVMIDEKIEDIDDESVMEETQACLLQNVDKKNQSGPEKKCVLEEILLLSEPMKVFFQKIQTFESLIQKGAFTKAALVSDDITHTIEHFNPALFFPQLFSRYFALVAQHIDTLSQEWENKKSPKWESLNRLYNVDLEEFLKW